MPQMVAVWRAPPIQRIPSSVSRKYSIAVDACGPGFGRRCGVVEHPGPSSWLCALITTLAAAISTLSAFYGSVAVTARGAAIRLKEFLKNNSSILVNYARARREGRRISTAPAKSVMNHLVNRRMSKRQQMRWSVKGAQLMLQARVDLLDGYLLQ